MNPKCFSCGLGIPLDKPIKVWSLVRDKFYHDLCLEELAEEARRYKAIYAAIRSPLDNLPPLNHPIMSGSIGDVWVCNLCGGFTGGYGREKCIHCGSKSHYGSGNGHYVQSDTLMKEKI